jgi:hypothetical protein
VTVLAGKVIFPDGVRAIMPRTGGFSYCGRVLRFRPAAAR